MNAPTAPRPIVDSLYYLVAGLFFAALLHYYVTGAGGPTLLAVVLVPVAFILHMLDGLRGGGPYPRLGRRTNAAVAALLIGLAALVAVYMHREFFEIRTVRAGIWSMTDLAIGGIMVLLVLEYSRRRHFALFVLNILLILYAVYGWVVPGLFGHLGLSWTRVASAMSVEMTTGVFSQLPQLALTVIGSFLLVLSILRAFGCVDAILKVAKRIAAWSPHALPQSAVVGSMAVGAVSGSGAANAATVGSATIPAMIGAGMPRARAAAIESSASLGGQLMPPVMGISAFLMAEFLGRSYFDVVARGYAPALIYYAGVSVSVYLLSVRYRIGHHRFAAEPITAHDWINLAGFLGVVVGLVAMMGVGRLPPMLAALYMFVAIAAALLAVGIAAALRAGGIRGLRALLGPLGRFLDGFAAMTADLTLLLATLSIMTGAFVITGIPTKVGGVLMDAAGVHLALMALVAFCFGALVGTGLPPAPTYILTALVIVPPMTRLGVDPWVVHFFAFFVGVWGELTPPTSVVAAVTAKIADTSFMRTLWHAIQMCIALFTLMAGVFARPALVVDPGLAQLGAALLVLAATVGLAFSLQARFSDRRGRDLAARTGLALLSLGALLSPAEEVAALAALLVAAGVGYWLLYRRNRAAVPAPQPA